MEIYLPGIPEEHHDLFSPSRTWMRHKRKIGQLTDTFPMQPWYTLAFLVRGTQLSCQRMTVEWPSRISQPEAPARSAEQ